MEVVLLLHGLDSLAILLRANPMLLGKLLRRWFFFLHGFDSLAILLRTNPMLFGHIGVEVVLFLYGLDSLAIPLRANPMLLGKLVWRWFFFFMVWTHLPSS